MKTYFDHEKRDAYKKAIAFAAWSEAILDVVSLLVGLIRSHSPDRLHGESIEYRVKGEGSSEGD